MVSKCQGTIRGKLTCLVCFSNAVSFSIAPVTFVYNFSALPSRCMPGIAYLCQLFSFRNLFVNLLGEVLVGLEDLDVGHCGECDRGRVGKWFDESMGVTEGIIR